jgi:cysteine desulfurase
MARTPVYLDYHATTPVDPRVLAAMLPYFTEVFGNPASASHVFGWKAQEAVERARRDVAGLVGASAREIVFTSGATESNNFAIRGALAHAAPDRRHLVTSAIEHKSVLESMRRLECEGWRLTVVPVDRGGLIDPASLDAAITPDTALVSVMAANNEIGVIQDVAAIGARAHAAGAIFHVDGAQAVGKIPMDVEAMRIDLLSFTGHKIYGPKGCGALYIRRRTDLQPMIAGGGQERGLRAGTLNVPGIVGLGEACAICRREMTGEAARIGALRDRLLDGLRAGLDGVAVNGSLEARLPNNLHVTLAGVDGESLLIGIGDIAVSSGSACSSASAAPSHVLQAIQADDAGAASIRFGLGRFTSEADIDYAVEKFTAVVRHLRQTSPVASPHALGSSSRA